MYVPLGLILLPISLWQSHLLSSLGMISSPSPQTNLSTVLAKPTT
jgi:hypothetical protein